METKLSRIRHSVKLAVIVLLVLELITLPMVLGYTLAAPESANHILTYTKGSLTWESGTDLDASGVARLTLFNSAYDNVESENGDNIIAPGTAGETVVRLQNQVSGSISYTALLFRSVKAGDAEADLPVEVTFTGEGLSDTTAYTLPDGTRADELVRAVDGTLSGYGVQDFIIDWQWLFEAENAEGESTAAEALMTGDELDTRLGVLAADGEEETVTVGLYIIVQDDNNYDGESGVKTVLPKTGDDSHAMWYLLLVILTLLAIVVLLVDERRRKKWEELHEREQ